MKYPSKFFYAFLALFCSLYYIILFIPDIPISGEVLKLGSGGYDYKTISYVPSINGAFLDSLSIDFSTSRVGPWIRRFLLNHNHVEMIRELAAQTNFPPLSYPMVRLSDSDLNSIVISAKETENSYTSVLRNGFQVKEYGKTYASVHDYAAAYKSKSITPSAVIQSSLAKVKEWEEKGLFIFSSINRSDVLKQAYESDMRFASGNVRSIFDGVPIAFKDMIGINGHSIYAGKNPKKTWSDTNRVDDPVVSRFRELGAIIFGVTIMTERDTASLGYNPFFKGPVNPYSTRHYPGGSSSGSAIAVALGIVPIAVGSDSGGSVRVPAALSGVFGLGSTFGRVSFEDPVGSTMLTGGLFSHSAIDLALGYMGISTVSKGSHHFYDMLYDGGSHGKPPANVPWLDDTMNLNGVRIGIFSDWFVDTDREVKEICTNAIIKLRELGVTLVEIKIPHLRWLAMAHGLKMSTEFAMEWDMLHQTRLEDIEPGTRVSVAIGSSVSSLEALSADKLRAWALNYTTELFLRENLVAMVNPTVGFTAPVLRESYKKHGSSDNTLATKLMKHIFLANFLGMPSISIPAGFGNCPETGVKLPVGIQLTTLHWREYELLKIAKVFDFVMKRSGIEPIQFVHPIKHAVGIAKLLS